MKKVNNKMHQIRWMRIFLILTVAYFSQVYSYIHLHHSHDSDFLPIEISFHPVDVDADHLPDHHDGEDHHHHLHSRIDWHVVRTQSQSISTSVRLNYLPHYRIGDPNDNILTGQVIIDEPKQYQNIPTHPLEIRGPPFSA